MFLVKRHTAVAVLAGAYVFPGGQLALSDSAEDIAALSDGVGSVRDRMAGVLEDDARAFRVAAVRELYEEAGILLARNRDGKPVGERHGESRRSTRGATRSPRDGRSRRSWPRNGGGCRSTGSRSSRTG